MKDNSILNKYWVQPYPSDWESYGTTPKCYKCIQLMQTENSKHRDVNFNIPHNK